MKQLLTIIAALFMVASCAQDLLLEVAADGQIAITATYDDDTRTFVANGGTEVYWLPDDRICVFRGAGMGCFTQKVKLATRTTVFYGTISNNPGEGEFVGVYPYNPYFFSDGSAVSLSLRSMQDAEEGTFGPDLYITMGHSDTDRMRFHPLCGGFRFSLCHEGIRRVSFVTTDGEPVAGSVRAAIVDEKPTVLEFTAPKSRIDLCAPDGGTFRTGEWYYIVALPAELAHGFRMYFYADDAWGIAELYNPVSIRQGVFGSRQNVDAGVNISNEYAHEAVDLGVSVKWASVNIGASDPADLGDHFAWGDTEPISDYNNYLWISGGMLTKYNTDSRCGTVDNLTVLDLEDDAAHARWGDSWRMPTFAEVSELWDPENCTWEWTDVDGVPGYVVTSVRPGFEGNSIFLPAGGWRLAEGVSDVGTRGWYWTSSLDPRDGSYEAPKMAIVMRFSPSTYSMKTWGGRKTGATIRPVYGPRSVPAYSLSLDRSSVDLIGSVTLHAVIIPENTTDTVEWTSSDPEVATVEDGVVTAVKKGTATITASVRGLTATCLVNVLYSTPETVDMGLSVKWATFNVGASEPEEFGDFFMWGDARTDYKECSWAVYKWCNGSSSTFKKYNTNPSYGTVDNKTVLDPEDDPATVYYGAAWRTPTKEELEELWNKDNCSWVKTKLNDVTGFLITSKKEGYTDKSLFWPLPGYRIGQVFYTHYDYGTNGHYWSSSLKEDNPSSAYKYSLYNYGASASLSSYSRAAALTVRAVRQ